MRAVVKPAGKHEAAADHFRRLDPRGKGTLRVFREFELNGSLGFALDHGNPFANATIPDQVSDGQLHQIASAKLAINCHVEQCKIAQVARQFEPPSDRPDLFRKQWSFLAGDPALVPSYSFRGDSGKLDSWHCAPSNPPAKPRHQHSADALVYWWFEWPLSGCLFFWKRRRSIGQQSAHLAGFLCRSGCLVWGI